MTTLEIGQKVWLHDVNDRGRGPERGTVVKVGRKLVTIEGMYGRPEVYRIDDGGKNDNYGHHWFHTDEQEANSIRQAKVVEHLLRAGLRREPGCRLTLEELEAVAAALPLAAPVLGIGAAT